MLDRPHYLRVTVSDNHWPPRADVVDVALFVGIPYVRALPSIKKKWRATHGLKGADRGVDPAGDDRLRLFKQIFVA